MISEPIRILYTKIQNLHRYVKVSSFLCTPFPPQCWCDVWRNVKIAEMLYFSAACWMPPIVSSVLCGKTRKSVPVILKECNVLKWQHAVLTMTAAHMVKLFYHAGYCEPAVIAPVNRKDKM